MASGKRKGRGDSAGRRQGRNTTFAHEAYDEDSAAVRPEELLDPEATGARVDPNIDGFHRPTAMFDQGEFLGELAELSEAPETRAKIDAAAEAPKGCRLIIVDGPDLGMEWSFKVAEITMGRDEDCELMMSDIAVSRRHAQVVREEERFFVVDLESGNGTFLNGQRVTRQELSPGDEISVGERTLRFVELNDSPATAAAHPVRSPSSEPQVGPADFGGTGDFEPMGGMSQVGVDVADEPSMGNLRVDPVGTLEPERGAALRKVVTTVGVLALCLGIGAAGWFIYERYFAGESPAESLARSKREFLQGVELAKNKRCGDAIIMFNRVLLVRPGYDRATQYREHCAKEVAVFQQLETARDLGQAGEFSEALASLRGIDAASAYAEDSQNLGEHLRKEWAQALLQKARREWSGGDIEAARALIAKALKLAPGLPAALRLMKEIDAGAEVPPPPPKRSEKPPLPPQLARAVALYRQGKVSAGIDAAETAPGSEAEAYAGRMKQVKKLLRDAQAAHQAKAGAELLRVVPAALGIDLKIAEGRGTVRDRLQRYYADGLYLKGIEAYQGRDDVKAYEMLSQAVKIRPEHRLARSRLADLKTRARELYYEGVVLKESDPAQARKIFKRVVKMTSRKESIHKSAARWLKKNGA